MQCGLVCVDALVLADLSLRKYLDCDLHVQVCTVSQDYNTNITTVKTWTRRSVDENDFVIHGLYPLHMETHVFFANVVFCHLCWIPKILLHLYPVDTCTTVNTIAIWLSHKYSAGHELCNSKYALPLYCKSNYLHDVIAKLAGKNSLSRTRRRWVFNIKMHSHTVQ